MLEIFICEDNDDTRFSIEEIIQRHISIHRYDMFVRYSTGNPKDLLKQVKAASVKGIYFLDVELKASLNGIQLAEQIRKYDPKGYIIFVTTHNEMMPETFKYKVEALDFIEKDDIGSMKSFIKNCLEHIHKKQKQEAVSKEKKYGFKSGDKEFFVDYSDIIYFETTGISHKVRITTDNRKVEFYGNLTEIEEELDDRFCRCHNSIIINCTNIKELNRTKREILMNNGSTCKASTKGMRMLKQKRKVIG